ncbi:hypothetical protein [Pseudoalteromonas xiamenensis]
MRYFSVLKQYHYSIQVVTRFILAILGGYVLTAITISALTIVFPLSQVDAVLVSTTISIAIYAIFFIAAFAISSIKKATVLFLVLGGVQITFLSLIKGWL